MQPNEGDSTAYKRVSREKAVAGNRHSVWAVSARTNASKLDPVWLPRIDD
jgi:hypothetical protein